MLSHCLRWLRSNPRALDVAMVLGSVLISFPGVTVSVDSAPTPSPHSLGYLITGVSCASLIEARRRARTVAVVTVACAAALAVAGYILSPLLLAPAMVALVLIAVRTSQMHALVSATLSIAVLFAAMLITRSPGSPLAMELIGTVAWLLLAVAIGRAAQLRSAYLDAAEARADYAERSRDEEAMRRVAGERIRIARELHDVTAHHLALANAQAGTVAHLMGSDLVGARSMVADLNRTIIAALEDLGATVGLLRQTNETESPLEPPPGLAQLPDLAATFERANLRVFIATDGKPVQLPQRTDLTAYRIIQESLTNVTKHSAADTAEVRIAYFVDRLSISVTDNGGTGSDASDRVMANSGSGYGLIGMRERTQSLGGALHTGPRPKGGFEIRADLPLHPHEPNLEHRR